MEPLGPRAPRATSTKSPTTSHSSDLAVDPLPPTLLPGREYTRRSVAESSALNGKARPPLLRLLRPLSWSVSPPPPGLPAPGDHHRRSVRARFSTSSYSPYGYTHGRCYRAGRHTSSRRCGTAGGHRRLPQPLGSERPGWRERAVGCPCSRTGGDLADALTVVMDRDEAPVRLGDQPQHRELPGLV